MIVKKEDISRDRKNEKKYDRVIYWCKKDDVWIAVETPKGGGMECNFKERIILDES